jgi:hypothetical protein
MSWLSKNYEKASLGAALAAALGLAYFGWSKVGGVEDDFSAQVTSVGNDNPAVIDADLIPKAKSSMLLDRSWKQALDGERAVDLFTGIPLFVPSATPDKAIDLLNKDSVPVHSPVPNTWWLENRLDPGFADSPNRDPDGDGFSNLEEFTAKTNPNDDKSIPPLLAKLTYLRDDSLGWVIRPSYGEGGSFPFNYFDLKGGRNKTVTGNLVAPNELFFATGLMANRFKLLGSEVRKEVNPRTTAENEVTYVRIEDQRANKKGVVYEFPAPLSEQRMNEYLKYDRTAVFSLEALGLDGKEFKVEENLTFALPPTSAKKEYTLKSVTPEAVSIEYTTPSGESKVIEIKKGTMPNLGE